MNKVLLMGRLTRDPEIRYSNQPDGQLPIARFTLAVDRRMAKKASGNNEQTADFIGCIAFGKQAEFAEKYLRQGTKMVIEGRIQTGSYTNREGQKVYTTDIIVENLEFAESKAAATNRGSEATNNNSGYTPARSNHGSPIGDGFMNIPDGVDDEGLPFI